jgi:hypothetical protein
MTLCHGSGGRGGRWCDEQAQFIYHVRDQWRIVGFSYCRRHMLANLYGHPYYKTHYPFVGITSLE